MFRLKTEKEATDEESMVRFQNGDAGCFDLILERHGGGVLRFIMKMIGLDKVRSEDLLQEVFMKVIERRMQYDQHQKFSTWLYSIARNHCIDFLRNEEHRRHASLDAPLNYQENDAPVVIDFIKSRERDQEAIAIDRETQELLQEGIRELREEYRDVFLLREVEGLPLEQIATITEAPLSTVKSRLRYAYRDLRDMFIKHGYFREEQRVKEV